ncbi:MAG: AAA family ATPase, partial [Planctomycetales bacterium]|nr:AAA family ATPase [Planctomycetales bacterium]
RMVTIAVCNQKGGVGKTTSVASLSIVLSRAGHQVHLIDADPQASLSRRVFSQFDNQGLLYQALTKRISLPVIEVGENLTLSPSSIHLAKGESQFLSLPAREYLLQKSLQATELGDDTIVLIDCPPSLGILTFNCLTAASSVVIPIFADELAADVLPNLLETIKTAKKHLNSDLSVLGAILTKVDSRQKIARLFEENISKALPLLGSVHSESELQYAVGGGSISELRRSRALHEYEMIANKITKAVCQTAKISAKA